MKRIVLVLLSIITVGAGLGAVKAIADSNSASRAACCTQDAACCPASECCK